MVQLEADAEGDWDVVAVHAVLREYVKTIQVCISEGKIPCGVEGVDKTRFGIELCPGETAEFIGHATADVDASGVAGIAVEALVDLKLKAVAEEIAFLTERRSREGCCLVIEAPAADNIRALVVVLIEVIDRVNR